MSAPDLISASEVIRRIIHASPSERIAAIDVRSEGEFAEGSIPGFLNMPILKDAERHEVGLAYKQEGQEQAIRLGHSLVEADRARRTQGWLDALSGAELSVVTCWRGGLRSQIASSWISEAGGRVVRIEGGYKAMRNHLLPELETPPKIRILSGMTGTGKTDLLNLLKAPNIDLEGLAKHRGSSFGRSLEIEQPRQADFENQLAIEIMKKRATGVLLEDESIRIGSVSLPKPLKAAMKLSPVVLLRSNDDDRLIRIHRDYVVEPVTVSGSAERVLSALLDALERIRSKLGHAMTDQIARDIRAAFACTVDPILADPERHRAWIVGLLHNYYDKQYRYAFEQQERTIVFEGGFEECRQWIEANPSA